MLHLDHLKVLQKNFTPCGLNIVIEWMYGSRIEFSTDKLTDALGAAFALEMSDVVDAIEQAVLTYTKNLSNVPVLLHHFDSFTPKTKRKLLTESLSALEEISTMKSFSDLPLSIFKRVIKEAINNLKNSDRGPFGVIKAIVLWESENCNHNVSMSLLKQTPIDGLSNIEMNRLVEMTRELGLEKLAERILCQYRTLNTS
ncbi:hypothetical protein KIN20_015127 [Parelaphostrongylus tenuis]|uniref:Uncharacterized protein n=1 Tax=Parelaphostrongylus tenuis TaxID=148309 RepID=A0AAD5QPR3_PARTN|nr:hypothetical protein KIN20_015127 [Parelaphostrongylus tenuis]